MSQIHSSWNDHKAHTKDGSLKGVSFSFMKRAYHSSRTLFFLNPSALYIFFSGGGVSFFFMESCTMKFSFKILRPVLENKLETIFLRHLFSFFLIGLF